MARASGLALAGGPEHNDPLRASTIGTGELLAAVFDTGARQVIVGVGGSATTDGGLGCLRALPSKNRLAGGRAAGGVRRAHPLRRRRGRVRAPEGGATPAQVALLERRLERLAQVYEEDYGIDVRPSDGGGAAGGLAGGLAAIGATLEPGFDLVAGLVELEDRIDGADLVVTGEGFLDEQSFRGKVVGGVLDLARAAGVPNPERSRDRARRRRGNQTPPTRCQCPNDEEEHVPFVQGSPLSGVRAHLPGRGAARLRLLLRAPRGGLRLRGHRRHGQPGEDRRRPAHDLALRRPAARRPTAPVDLGAGFTPLVRADRLAAELGLGELWIKNDTVNPTGSFKDRVVSVALTKARELGFKVAACASTGNLANSVAAHAARAGHGVDRVHPL